MQRPSCSKYVVNKYEDIASATYDDRVPKTNIYVYFVEVLVGRAVDTLASVFPWNSGVGAKGHQKLPGVYPLVVPCFSEEVSIVFELATLGDLV